MRKIILAAAALAGIAAFAVPAAASAGTTPGAVFAVTHSPQHNDTTSGGPGAACGSSSNGPTWALDNLEEKFTVVPVSGLADGANYSVTIDVVGSFAGFADPNTCNPLVSSGPVHGTIQYDVSSPVVPDKAGLLPNQAPDTGLGAALQQLMPGSTIVGGGAYNFSYQNGNYVQDTFGITGSIRGH